MPTLTIDGKQVTVKEGTSVINAAEEAGIYIPRYCYHPGLTVAGSCRMCLVEIEGMPKLQISCHMTAQEGMKVSTVTDTVKRARQAMLEFLLSNHPLDCPVCDQSGECDLQNFYMDYGLHDSRFLENKRKGKKAVPIGPHVMLDQERCILCTRCARFTNEVSRTHELGVFNRGSDSVIDLAPGRVLDNPYSGNVIDICPVGALTEREFRFQCRVWYLSEHDSVCPGCSRGCNISIHYNKRKIHKAGGRRVMRVKPVFNADINKWWICDRGRFGYLFIDENRIEQPCLKSVSGHLAVEWDKALTTASDLIKNALDNHGSSGIGVIFSPKQTNEELETAKKLFTETCGVTYFSFINPWEEPGLEDDLLMKADSNPNTRGASDIGLQGDTAEILRKAADGELKLLIIFRHSFDSPEALELINKANRIIYIGTNWNETARQADVVLAGTVFAEKDGSFTNFEGGEQHFTQVFLPIAGSRDDTGILEQLSGRMNTWNS